MTECWNSNRPGAIQCPCVAWFGPKTGCDHIPLANRVSLIASLKNLIQQRFLCPVLYVQVDVFRHMGQSLNVVSDIAHCHCETSKTRTHYRIR